MNIFATNRRLRARILELEAEISRLRAVEQKFMEQQGIKKERLATRKSVATSFFGYRNYRHVARNKWPDVMCHECASHKTRSGGKKQKHYYCKILGIQVAKFSSCLQAAR